MAKVVLENVCKIYPGNVKAVDNANLVIEDREFVVLVGPSGCGKSTTLRMIAGLEDISSGTVTIDGKVVNNVPPKDRDIAMVFQNYALYPHMTVYKNLAFGLQLRKFPKDEIDRRVKDAAQILGLESYLDRKPKALSGGQRQRVAVGRAIVRKPKAFLFDEPLSNLDAKMRVHMRMEIKKLHARLNSTMIYVTHDQVEAMTLGDRIVVMKDGLIQQVDDPLTIYHRPQNMFVAGFIGSPPMDFFTGALEARDGKLFFRETAQNGGGFSVRVADDAPKNLVSYVGKTVKMGVRPEDIVDVEHARQPQPDQNVEVTVDVIEPMGSEIYAHLKSSGHAFIARLDPHCRVAQGDKFTAAFNMSKAHFFDPDSEKRIE
jgi:multiple sugar transport system ATP-binding protein